MEFFQLMFESMWHFIGFVILLNGLGYYIFKMWNRFWRHFNIRKHGYPPKHCDADGDLYENQTN